MLCNLFKVVENIENEAFNFFAKLLCGRRNCDGQVVKKSRSSSGEDSIEGVDDSEEVLKEVKGFIEEVLSRPKRQFDVHSILGIFQTYVCSVNISPSLEKRSSEPWLVERDHLFFSKRNRDVKPTTKDYFSLLSVFGQPLCCLLKFIRQD